MLLIIAKPQGLFGQEYEFVWTIYQLHLCLLDPCFGDLFPVSAGQFSNGPVYSMAISIPSAYLCIFGGLSGCFVGCRGTRCYGWALPALGFSRTEAWRLPLINGLIFTSSQ